MTPSREAPSPHSEAKPSAGKDARDEPQSPSIGDVVEQRADDDCTICSIAMATGLTYEAVMTVAEKSEGGYRYQGKPGTMSPKGVLIDLGCDAQRIMLGASVRLSLIQRFLWGRRAILSMPSLNGFDGHHDVFWDGRAIRDPSTKPATYAHDALTTTPPLFATILDDSALLRSLQARVEEAEGRNQALVRRAQLAEQRAMACGDEWQAAEARVEEAEREADEAFASKKGWLEACGTLSNRALAAEAEVSRLSERIRGAERLATLVEHGEGDFPISTQEWHGEISRLAQDLLQSLEGGGSSVSQEECTVSRTSPSSPVCPGRPDKRHSAGGEPLGYVERLFGRAVSRLSVPGSRNGIQSIDVDFKDGSGFHVEGATVDEAWARLAEAAEHVKAAQSIEAPPLGSRAAKREDGLVRDTVKPSSLADGSVDASTPSRAGWRDIASAPKDGTPILACSTNHDAVEVVCWQDGVPSGSQFGDVNYEPEEGWVNNGQLKDRFYANPRWFTHWKPVDAPPESPSPAGWRLISDPPRQGDPCLFWWPGADYPVAARSTGSEAIWLSGGGHYSMQPVTHWQPLPDPPSSAKPAEREGSRDAVKPSSLADGSVDASTPSPAGQGEPVAWRVKDFGDGWIHCQTLAYARHLAEGVGSLIQPLYLSPDPHPLSPLHTAPPEQHVPTDDLPAWPKSADCLPEDEGPCADCDCWKLTREACS